MSNEKQITHWNEVAGPKWVKIATAMDERFAAITKLLLDRAAARPGETVLDIGCGTGTTALKLARAVLPGGAVTGIDVSAPMLDVASIACAAEPNISLLQADAQSHDFGALTFDLLVSRFGVMFFANPEAAFTNLHRALKPGGRLCFVCWAPLAANPPWQIPFDIVTAHCGPPEPKPPHAPGPMAFDDPAYVENILHRAGFTGISVAPTELSIIGKTLEEETAIACTLGPAGALLDEKNADAAMRELLREKIAAAIAHFMTPEGMRPPATIHLVTASA